MPAKLEPVVRSTPYLISRMGIATLIAALAVGCTTGDTATTTTSSTTTTGQPPPATASSALDQILDELQGLPFEQFLEDSYRQLLMREPQFLTSLGVAAEYGLRNDRLDDLSDAYLRETQAFEAGILGLLREYDRDSLPPESRTSFDVYEWYLDTIVDGHRFLYHDYPVHHFVNSYNDNLLLFFTEEHPLATRDDAEDYITRLTAIDDQVDQLIAGLQTREEMGNIPPNFIVSMTVNRLKDDLNGADTADAASPADLRLFASFRDRISEIEGLSDADRRDLLDRALAATTDSFVPAWVALLEHMTEVRSLAGPDPGLWRLPDGDEYYQHLLREMTSTDLTAEQIHQIGLEQVDRLQAELRALFDSLGYPQEVTTVDLLRRAAADAGFLNGSTAAGKQEAVEAWEALIDEMDPLLEPYFSRKPVADVIVIPEQYGSGGYYVAGSVDGSRPGSFHAGVGGSQIPTYIMPTIAYHEAVPGHHYQIALAQELALPTFRRYNRYNAFVEGWALYAERLAAEMGMYDDDPYGDVGRLELELVRAVRLVTDTGIHAMGWTRIEAEEYMDSVVGWSHEVQRYTVLPGQATGYMIGQQEILRLRQEAQERLGDDFDIAEFHDVVLGGGSVPFGVLAELIYDYLDQKTAP